MIQDRAEMDWDEEEPDTRPARDSFTPLAGQPEQQGYLPPQDDQSWREREAMRLGYFAPRDEFARAQDRPDTVVSRATESVEADSVETEIAAAEIPETEAAVQPGESLAAANGDFELRRQFPDPATAGKGGKSFMLALGVILGAAVLLPFLFPQILTAQFWSPHETQAGLAPVLASSPKAPAPRPRAADKPAPIPLPKVVSPPVVEPDAPAGLGAGGEEAAPVSAGAPKSRADERKDALARPAGGEGDGFYAMVPGPDGTMTYRHFSADPAPKPNPGDPTKGPDRANGREKKGVYALAPGPDGKLEYQYFPPPPPPR